ncbi:MAG: hypothetical protein ACJ8AT_35115 [Hyalangium sp.]|uniref:hypothetical protein n=1 Tax=Hyalangium sp. TaxID=2028555 RepID=UPI0038998A10
MKKLSSYYGDTQAPPAPTDDLIVRPDILRATFQVQLLGAFASQEALARLQQESEQLRRKLREATSAEVTLKMTGVLLSAAPMKRLRIPEDDDEARTGVAGTLEFALPTSLDFWARSARMAALGRTLNELSADERKVRGQPAYSFTPPTALVAEPEQHRAELLRRFVSRVQEFSAVASTAEAPLRVVDCTAPGPVIQTPISIESVGLSLLFSYRLDAPH